MSDRNLRDLRTDSILLSPLSLPFEIKLILEKKKIQNIFKIEASYNSSYLLSLSYLLEQKNT